jgi:hypothetical protein
MYKYNKVYHYKQGIFLDFNGVSVYLYELLGIPAKFFPKMRDYASVSLFLKIYNYLPILAAFKHKLSPKILKGNVIIR